MVNQYQWLNVLDFLHGPDFLGRSVQAAGSGVVKVVVVRQYMQQGSTTGAAGGENTSTCHRAPDHEIHCRTLHMIFLPAKLWSRYASIQYFVVGPEWGLVEKSTFSIAMAWGKSLLRHLWPIMILKLHWKGCLYWPSCKNFRRWDQSLVSWDLFFGGGSCFLWLHTFCS